jgi:hypothetical protein
VNQFTAVRAALARVLTPTRRRWLWRGLSALAVIMVLGGAYLSAQTVGTADLRFSPGFFLLSFAIYLLTYLAQLAGWHLLTRQILGPQRFRTNAEAVAGSTLVKYLPTGVVWYIANRADYYQAFGVPAGAVVAASLVELALTLGAASGLLLLSWLVQSGELLAGLGLLLLAGVLALLLRGRAVSWWARAVATRRTETAIATRRGWLLAAACYASCWPLGVLFLWALIGGFTPVTFAQIAPLFVIYPLISLAGYLASLTLGVLAIAREISLVALLGAIWPLPVAVATAVALKVTLSLFEIGCSLVVLGVLRLAAQRRTKLKEMHDA